MCEGFDSDQAQKYRDQADRWYGGPDSVKEAWKDFPKPDEYMSLQKKAGEMQRKLSNLLGLDVRSAEVKSLLMESESVVRELYRVDTPKEVLMDIARRYQADGDMHEFVDYMYGEGAASFIAKSILAFYEEDQEAV